MALAIIYNVVGRQRNLGLNANQFNSTILANKQHNSVYSESNIYLTVPCVPCLVHINQNNNCISLLADNNQNTTCLEHNCTLKLTRTVFSLVAMLNFYFRFRLISRSNVCQNSSASVARLKTFKFYPSLYMYVCPSLIWIQGQGP